MRRTGGSGVANLQQMVWLTRKCRQELVLILIGIPLCLFTRPLVEYPVLARDRAKLRGFAAQGTILEFRSVGHHQLLAIESDITASPGLKRLKLIKSRAFRLGADVLRQGARFEKTAGTSRCVVDGVEYDLY